MSENWYWIELTAFDREAADYGVGDFVWRTSGKIEGLSFLFSNIDFVNLHNGITGKTLSPSICSYGGLPYGEERPRQPWKDVELKGLVKELQKNGIKVLFSFFNTFTYGTDEGTMGVGEFCAAHREIWDRNKNGDEVYGINVLKTLSDGTPYADFLFEKINEVIADYGFDGVQLADGISTARLSVMNGDFSDDVVSKFIAAKNVKGISAHTADKSEYRARRKYIIENLYADYLEYLTERWKAYYDKAFSVIKGIIIFNNAWTCDPFESYYRYGFDYSVIGCERAYAMMVEEVSPTRPILSKEDNAGYDSTVKDCASYHYKHMLMQMSNKINVPEAKLVALTSIKDVAEQWDIIRHSPMELQRALVRRNNTFVYRDGLKKCIDAPFFCLSTSVKKEDWDWLFSNLGQTEAESAESVCGYTALFSRQAVKKEVRNYIETKDYSSSEFNLRLLTGGLDIGCMTDAENVEKIKSPVLVTNYDFLSETEKEALKRVKAPLAVIGKNTSGLNGYKINAGYGIVLMNAVPYEGIEKDAEKLLKYAEFTPAKGGEDRMGGLWTCPLKYNSLPEGYFKTLAGILSKFAGLAEHGKNGQVTAIKLKNGKTRYFLSNDSYKYNLMRVTTAKELKSAVSTMKYKGYRVYIDGKSFTDRVPPRGVCIVETEDKEDDK